MAYTNNHTNLQHTAFEDAQDFASFAAETAGQLRNTDFKHRVDHWLQGAGSAKTGRSAFSSVGACCEAVTQTWKEGIDRINRLAAVLADAEVPELKSRVRQRRWSQDDGEMDTDRYLGNADDFYQESTREVRQGPASVTLIANTSANCDVSAEQAAWRGALCVALTDFFENAGYPTEVIACFGSTDTYMTQDKCKRNQLFSVVAKESGDSLDISTLANLTSPWCFRTLGFFCLCHLHPEPRADYGLGQAMYGAQEPVLSKDLNLSGDLVLELPQVFEETSTKAAMQNLMGMLQANDQDNA